MSTDQSKVMRVAADNLAKKHDDLIVVYAVQDGEKLSLVIAVSKSISSRYNAGKIVKSLKDLSGGGSAILAQAGGTSNIRHLNQNIINAVSVS